MPNINQAFWPAPETPPTRHPSSKGHPFNHKGPPLKARLLHKLAPPAFPILTRCQSEEEPSSEEASGVRLNSDVVRRFVAIFDRQPNGNGDPRKDVSVSFPLVVQPQCNQRLSWGCGSNVFQGYFDNAKESRVKQIPKIQDSRVRFQESRFKIQESSFKIQDSRIIKIKIQESREDSIKISTKKVFQNIE